MTTDLGTLLQPTRDQDDYVARLERLSRRRGPTVFGMRTKLPAQGRADMPVAATDRMTVVVKTYAESGENGLHAHPHEDHSFVVLQGRARFHGEDGELGRLGPHQGILLPRGAYYRFQAEPGEPLVMIRFGCTTDPDADQHHRINTKEDPSVGWDAENKTEDLVLTEEIFE